jgi:hypothetical protein
MLKKQMAREELIQHLDNNDLLFDRWIQEQKISANDQGLFETCIFERLRAEVYGYNGPYLARAVSFSPDVIK